MRHIQTFEGKKDKEEENEFSNMTRREIREEIRDLKRKIRETIECKNQYKRDIEEKEKQIRGV